MLLKIHYMNHARLWTSISTYHAYKYFRVHLHILCIDIRVHILHPLSIARCDGFDIRNHERSAQINVLPNHPMCRNPSRCSCHCLILKMHVQAKWSEMWQHMQQRQANGTNHGHIIIMVYHGDALVSTQQETGLPTIPSPQKNQC